MSSKSNDLNYNELSSQLKYDEGFKLKPYIDTASKITIGCGRCLTDVGISEDECNILLQNDIDSAVKFLNDNLPWWVDLSEPRKRVLVNMAFNLRGNLLDFRLFLSALRQGNYNEAASEMLDSKWALQVGDRAKRLAKVIIQDWG